MGVTERVQGWKLHLSSILTEAPALLRRVIPLLQAEHLHFKIARDAGMLAILNEGRSGVSQIGKFITIYPEDDDEALAVARELIAATAGFAGPRIPSDLWLGGIIYARYGAFNPIMQSDRFGQPLRNIYNASGELQADNYQIPYTVPENVVNPFELLLSSDPAIDEAHTNRLFGPAIWCLKSSSRTRKARSFARWTCAARIWSRTRSSNRDATTALSTGMGVTFAHGFSISTNSIANLPTRWLSPPPTLISKSPMMVISSWNSIPGEALQDKVNRWFATGTWQSFSASQKWHLLTYLRDLMRLLARLHTAGFVHRDLTGSNVWITEDEQVYLLDLELTYDLNGSEPLYELGTPGFMSPQQEQQLTPTTADDIYALGGLLLYVLLGRESSLSSLRRRSAACPTAASPARRRRTREFHSCHLPCACPQRRRPPPIGDGRCRG